MPPRGALRFSVGTYIVEQFSTVKKGLRVPEGRHLLVGHQATVSGPVVGGADVLLARGARIRGSVETPVDVVVGALATVEGDVEAGGNVLILEGARVRGAVRAKGRVRIVGAFVDGSVRAGGDVEVRGESVVGEIQAGGRVRTLPAPESDEPTAGF